MFILIYSLFFVFQYNSYYYIDSFQIATYYRYSNLQCQSTILFASRSKSSKDETYYCSNCGIEHIKWIGKCSSCNEWNSVKAFRKISKNINEPLDIRNRASSITSTSTSRWIDNDKGSNLLSLSEIDISVATSRISLQSSEVNRVLGGGIVPGSVILLAGEPGIGKSTLLLQLAVQLISSRDDQSVVYVSGEETSQQIASRCHRLKLDTRNIYLLNEVNVDSIIDQLLIPSSSMKPPALLIVDSIQTVYTSTCPNSIGSVTQIRESAAKLLQFAKATNTAVVLVGHVTKSGDVAGPRVLEHMVDTVLNFEGSENSDYRLLRTIKNRFGSTFEIGVFSMTSMGLADVSNPSELFMSTNIVSQGIEGSAVSVILEGSRPILAEVQCLVGSFIPPSVKPSGSMRRTVEGYSLQRLLLICAVLEKIIKLNLYSRDIFVNIVGGLRITEPSADLAVAVTIVSSYLSRPIQKSICFIGEIGLGGDIRSCRNIELRIQEAIQLGFLTIVIPKKLKSKTRQSTVETDSKWEGRLIVKECQTVKEALAVAFDVASIDEILKSNRKKSPAINTKNAWGRDITDLIESTDEIEEDY